MSYKDRIIREAKKANISKLNIKLINHNSRIDKNKIKVIKYTFGDYFYNLVFK